MNDTSNTAACKEVALCPSGTDHFVVEEAVLQLVRCDRILNPYIVKLAGSLLECPTKGVAIPLVPLNARDNARFVE